MTFLKQEKSFSESRRGRVTTYLMVHVVTTMTLHHQISSGRQGERPKRIESLHINFTPTEKGEVLTCKPRRREHPNRRQPVPLLAESSLVIVG